MKRLFGLLFAAVALVCSCTQEEWHAPYDDSALKAEIEALKGRVTTLENDFTSLQGMLEGKLLIKSAVQEGKNWVITLSDDKSFTVYPEAEKVEIPEFPEIPQIPANLITVTEIDGVKYWAMYVDGKAEAVLDAEGNKVPVSVKMPEMPEIPEIPEPIVPQFKTEDGAIYVSFDKGNSWQITGYEPVESETPGCTCTNTSLIDNFEIVTEEAYGEEIPVYGIFTLVDGYQFTVTFEGYLTSEFSFSAPSAYYTKGSISHETNSPALYHGSAEYMLEAPLGWGVQVLQDSYGDEYVQITSPTAEAIASGEAVAEGYIKAIGVMPGGKAVSAKMLVTTNAFEVSINPVDGTVTAIPHESFMGYSIYGVCPASDFDADAIAEALKGAFIGMNDMPEGSMMPEYGVWENIPLEEIYGKEIEAGEPMLFWAAPLAEEMDYDTYDYYYLLEGCDIMTKDFKTAVVTVEPELLAWNDIQISAKLLGVDTFYYGIMSSEYFNYDEFVEYELPYISYSDPVEGPIDYKGTLAAFPDGDQYNTDILPDKSYTMWIVLAKEDGQYTADDVMIWEFSTDPVEAGGSAEAKFKDVEEGFTDLMVTIENPGGLVYYAWVNTIEDLPAYPTDKLKFEYLLENGYVSMDMEISSGLGSLQPGQQWTLIAAVVDENGKYGPVKQQDCQTKALQYASGEVTLVRPEGNIAADTDVTIQINCTSAAVKQYRYYTGTTDESAWNSRLGGSLATAQEYLILNDNYYVKKTTEQSITLNKVRAGKEYVVVVVAELEDGTFTEGDMVTFKPTMNLGNFVRRDADGDGQDDAAWLAARPTVTYGQTESFGDFTFIPYSITPVEGYTTYSICSHKDFLTMEGISTPEQMVEYLYAEGDKIMGSANLGQPYGGANYGVFITWCDAEGNFYEPEFVDANVSGSGFGV